MSRAPHILLERDDGGMTLPPVESVVQSYASLAASLDAASFPPLTRRKPVSSPIRSHKNHRETRGRERQEKKQEALVALPDEHSALQALAPDDPIVEDLEAKVMTNFVKFERNMTRLVEEREAAPRLRAAVADHRRVSLLPTAAAASAATGNDDSVSDEETFHKSPSRRAIARAARKLNRERQAKEESHFDPARDPWFTAPSNAKPLESLQDAITQAEYRELTSSQFHMAGYGTKISYQEAADQLPRSCRASRRISRSEERHQLREFRMQPSTTDEYLAFEAFEQYSIPTHAAFKSAVFESEEYESIVDTGTTVTIEPKTDSSQRVDPRERIKISGFDGHVTQSLGVARGTVAFGTNRSGAYVRLKMPTSHVVPGAPHALLSVSAMVRAGYTFQFSQSGSYMVTPSMDIVDLIERGGLFWLKFKRAVVPAAHHAAPDAKFVLSDAANFAAQSKYRPATVVDDDDPCICTLLEEPSSLLPDVTSLSCTCSPGSLDLSTPGAFAGTSRCGRSPAYAGGTVPLPLMHRRLAHFNLDYVKAACDREGSGVTVTGHTKNCNCDACREAKQTRASIPKVRETPSTATRPFQHIYSDVKGKIATADFWGRRYFITFTCEVTRYTCVYFMRKKSEAKTKFLDYLRWVRQQSDSDGKAYRVHQLRTDGGGEYTANEKAVILSEFSELCKDGKANLQGRKIRHTKTSAHTPQQNGISERLNRTLANAARTSLIDMGLSHMFWSLAIAHAVWTRNRIGHSNLSKNESPYQILHKQAPKLNMARVFGSWCWKFDHMASGFQKKSDRQIFVGYSNDRKGSLPVGLVRRAFRCAGRTAR